MKALSRDSCKNLQDGNDLQQTAIGGGLIKGGLSYE